METNKSSQTVKDLRSLAKQRGLTGYTRLTKAELSQLIKNSESLIDGRFKVTGVYNPRKPPREGTVRWLKSRAKALGFTGISRYSKEELERLIHNPQLADLPVSRLRDLLQHWTGREQLISACLLYTSPSPRDS